ncbi:ABC transporter ATP-binding protein [Stutzerimonas chloritidismutans]|uniref:ABC transporter ATP-binding protein n=1 Tax=Stutzerimonas chloritidismutans TaxID=203192 RepID=A0ACC5VPR5_STUCH|nr:ABC transporter ATP-binding protein [Stutzerimonas chloritidismutans]MBX7274334.1 ABC transporter ATP-binding protein [Stutzerimonas chloritidismutans]
MSTILVSNLGKAYKQYPSRWSRLLEWLTPGHRPRHSLKWVLREVNFTVHPGQAIGIIGDNGAGKSTLLKIITGTTKATTGKVKIRGRVAALLELGMGFHPDFTGRQNAYMAAQLSGLSKAEIEHLMPEIERFADVGFHFDEPVRTYSSGMQARVAFSVATSVSPDILIVDEALSVGDIGFQAKCMQRMSALLASGTTVLFVSHALNQIRQFCHKALYLSDGMVKAYGEADYVCDLYQNDSAGFAARDSEQRVLKSLVDESSETSPYILNGPDPNLRKFSVDGGQAGTNELEFWGFQILGAKGVPQANFHTNECIRLRVVIYANTDVPPGTAVGLLFADKNGYPLAACNSNYYGKRLPEVKKGMHVVVEWRLKCPFASGEFRVDIGLKPDAFSCSLYDRVFCAGVFTVAPDMSLVKENFGGYIYVESEIDVALIGC